MPDTALPLPPARNIRKTTEEEVSLVRIGQPYVPHTLAEKRAWVGLVRSAEEQFEEGVKSLGVPEDEAAMFHSMLGFGEMYDYANRTDHTL